MDDTAPFQLAEEARGADKVQEKYLVTIHHEESIFHANNDQTMMWGEPNTHMKTRGAGLMVSDFVEGFLWLSDHEYDSIPDDMEKPAKKKARKILQNVKGIGTMPSSCNKCCE